MIRYYVLKFTIGPLGCVVHFWLRRPHTVSAFPIWHLFGLKKDRMLHKRVATSHSRSGCDITFAEPCISWTQAVPTSTGAGISNSLDIQPSTASWVTTRTCRILYTAWHAWNSTLLSILKYIYFKTALSWHLSSPPCFSTFPLHICALTAPFPKPLSAVFPVKTPSITVTSMGGTHTTKKIVMEVWTTQRIWK